MIWVTRDYVHIDRVASPWIIKRLIDKCAQFVFLPRDEISDFVTNTGAIPLDTAGLEVELDHHECNGEKHCTFDAIVEKNMSLKMMKHCKELESLSKQPIQEE